jgi:hypothetical protein
MATNQPGPHIPSGSIASQLEQPKDKPKTLEKKYLDAKPGLVILDEEHASKLEPPKSKEDLKQQAKAFNAE